MKDKKEIENDILIHFMETTMIPYIENLNNVNKNEIKCLDESILDSQNMIKQYEKQKLEAERRLVELSKSELYINQIIEILKQSK